MRVRDIDKTLKTADAAHAMKMLYSSDYEAIRDRARDLGGDEWSYINTALRFGFAVGYRAGRRTEKRLRK